VVAIIFWNCYAVLRLDCARFFHFSCGFLIIFIVYTESHNFVLGVKQVSAGFVLFSKLYACVSIRVQRIISCERGVKFTTLIL